MQLHVYGDAGYVAASDMYVSPFPTQGITAEQEQFNLQMSQLHVSVEHGFAKVVNLWPYMCHYRQLKTFRQPVAWYYAVAVLLTNLHTCAYSSQTSHFYQCMPPHMHEYLGVPDPAAGSDMELEYEYTDEEQ